MTLATSFDPGTWAVPIAIVAIAVVGAIIKGGMWIGKMNEHKSATSTFIKEIRDDIKKIFDRLPPPTTVRTSPLRLTDFGKTIRKDLDAVYWVKQVAKPLRAQKKQMDLDQAQELAFVTIDNLDDPEMEKRSS